jgi:alpha-tubulin suppressor-like RCC1 family protein
MTSLSQLNESAASPIEVTDARPAGVIFDRLEPREDSFTITTLNRPLVPTFEISEIINYSTANVRYRLTINSTRSQFITNSSLTFATMPAGVSVATVTTTYAKQYTVTGFNSAAIWQKIKTPTWNIHSDFGLATIFYVLAEIIYYDAATSQDVSREWFIFDPRYYYVARLLPQFAVSAIIGNKKPFSAAITASFGFYSDAPFTYKRPVMGITVNAFVTANVRKAKQLNANLSSPVATVTATGNKIMRGNGAFAIQSSVVCLNTRVLAPMSQITLFVVAGRIGPGSATFIEGNGLPYYNFDGTLLNIGGLPPGITRIRSGAAAVNVSSTVSCSALDVQLVSAMVMSSGTMTVEGTKFKGTFVYPTATFTKIVSSVVTYRPTGALTLTSQVNVPNLSIIRDVPAAVQAVSSMSCTGQIRRLQVFTWGNNTTGQLGLGDTTQRTVPTEIINNKNWSSVSTGGNHTLAITSNGELWAWGDNTYGQVGDGTTTTRNSPVQIGIGETWSKVSAGARHSLALATNGDLYSWGDNSTGQLGLGDTTQRTSPAQVGGNAWRDISAGGSHSMATLLSNSSLYAWGDNTYAQLGFPLAAVPSPRTTPLLVRNTNAWLRISAGGTHSLGIKVVGSIQVIYAWGDNTYGQLGLGDTTQRTIPTEISSGQTWSQISAGENYSLARTIDDGTEQNGAKMYGWGLNSNGQLGLGDTTQRTSPVQIGTLRINDIYAGSTHALAITVIGFQLYAWGNNANGRTGLATTSGNTLTPTEITLNYDPLTGNATDAGGNHSAVIQVKIT